MEDFVLFLKENKDIISLSVSTMMLIISAIMAFISFITHKEIVERDCAKITIEALSKIRTKYFVLDNNDKLRVKEYVQSLEFFAVGVNEGIYDINIVRKMSGRRLIYQYENGAKEYLNADCGVKDYLEYKLLINKLKEYYK